MNKFKIGDRVRFLHYVSDPGNDLKEGSIGTIVGISENENYPLEIEWQDQGHVDDGYKISEVTHLKRRKRIKSMEVII